MTSAFENTGLSLAILEPLLSSRAGTEVGTYTERISSWRHSERAVGGYWDAAFTLRADPVVLDEWFAQGLGREVILSSSGLETVWEGFVNRLTYRLGPLTVTRGPLLSIANRVQLVYSTIDTGTNPPTLGIRKRTPLTSTAAAANDTNSQRDYGILQKMLSSGGATPADAAQIQAMYLSERAQPETGHSWATAGGGPEIQIECLGYVHFLSAYVFNATTTGEQNLSAKLTAILAADPNSILASSWIVTNTVQVPAYENDDDVAWGLIEAMVGMGDASNNRYLFKVGAGRAARYYAAPTDVEYLFSVGQGGPKVTTEDHALLFPWQVRAGKWAFLRDFLPGRTTAAAGSLRDDPRCAFLESVTFTAPWGLAWQGARDSRLDEKLKKLGLSGVGGV